MQGLCRIAGMSRQNFHKGRRRRSRRAVDEALVLELVRVQRRLQPMVGARKLMVLIAPELDKAGVSIGRDRFIALLACHDLLVPRRRCRGPRTTDSRHGFRVHGNLLKELELTAPHEAWVADLTYIRTEHGFVYLALVMDAFSRRIVGWNVGATLEASGCAAALLMAIAQLPKQANPIHHSDRGTQYCCGQYIELLAGRNLRVSMTEENHCYENAQAERLNGILKQEYGLGGTLRDLAEVVRVTKQAVMLYNTHRPHVALGYRTPQSIHEERAAA
jgi:putative transposase